MSEPEFTPETGLDFGFELQHGFAARHIRQRAKKLSRCTPFIPSDEEDLRQELYLDLVKRLPGFDPAAGCFNAWVKMVVRHQCLSLRRKAQNPRRCCGEVASLSTLVETSPGESATLAASLGPEDQDRMSGRSSSLPHDELELRADVDGVLEKLPRRLRQIARLLKAQSAADVARKLKLRPREIYSAIKELRKTFAGTGLEEFGKKSL